jgi:hypothetical protein
MSNATLVVPMSVGLRALLLRKRTRYRTTVAVLAWNGLRHLPAFAQLPVLSPADITGKWMGNPPRVALALTLRAVYLERARINADCSGLDLAEQVARGCRMKYDPPKPPAPARNLFNP